MNTADIRAMIARPFNAPPIKATPAGYVLHGLAYVDACDAYVACPCESHRQAFLATFCA